MTSFKYKPISLSGPAFRLLRVLKGDDDPIQCQLFESKLAPPEDFRDYAALSYTWGRTTRPCDIVMNGSRMTVTKNAYLALRDLRYKEKDRVLWIDALCIDQNNNTERAQQVQQMGSIYSKAEKVIIWLGEATYDTDYVMHYMKQLEKEGIKHAGQDISHEQWVKMWLAVVQCLTADEKDLLVEGLQSLLRRSWFKRVWIVQETANARAAEIVCGGQSVSASIFALMPSLLEITADAHCQSLLDIMPGSLRNRSWWAKKRDLHTLLVKFCGSEATDPRDNIYALLGISSDAYDTDLLRVNYEKGLQDVIFETIAFLLNFNKLGSPVCRFLNWTLPEFFEKLDVLANEVLECAMKVRHEEVVKLLLVRNDVNVNLRGRYGEMPLLWAAEGGHNAVVKLLLETGKVDVNVIDDYEGLTPLACAAKNGDEAMVKLLLKTDNVDLNLHDRFFRTPLSWAARNGHEAVVELLLTTDKVDVDLQDRDGRTPLSFAAEGGHGAVVKLLLAIDKVDVDLRDRDGRTPLSFAAQGGHGAVVKLLLATDKVDVDLPDFYGITALSLAAAGGHEGVVKLLIPHSYGKPYKYLRSM